ncbi:unnamed protein product [Phytophthora lilii]|uniref:Unnamed protein product n=1 Tax=Phytophthora lilii TaxID=2077276 RepID=A0A9W6TK37_9STRA|nr:unnamed protein product [Phytophthora lilii]
MGCCPSKCPGATAGKEYAATTTEVLPAVSVNQVEPVLKDAVQDMLMDRGDGTPIEKSDDEEPAAEDDYGTGDDYVPGRFTVPPEKVSAFAAQLEAALIREATTVQSPPPPPRKSSRSADDIPISSTYHRVHSAEVAEQEAKRQEELRLEAEQRERDVREYKAAVQVD